MKLYTSAQMRELDRLASERCKIPSLQLMECSGMRVAETVREFFLDVRDRRIAAVCGPGNNGGDGCVAARVLHNWGARVEVFLLADPAKLKGDSKANFSALKKGEIFISTDFRNLKSVFERSDCIIDAIFGTGLKRKVENETAAVIEQINHSGKPVVAVDIPSGIDADTGKVIRTAINAAMTVTLGGAKLGLYVYPGKSHAGKIKVADIGIPPQLLNEFACAACLVEAVDVRAWVSVWKPDIHKGERGRVMIIGGSRGYSGAPALASLGALYSGAGLVYCAVPDGIRTLMEHKLTEVIKVGIPQTNSWVLGKGSLAETRLWFDKIDAMAIGPGIGRDSDTHDYVRAVIQEYPRPLVIDADALFALDENFLTQHGRPSWILTPHEGEMGRLCGMNAGEIRENRLRLAQEKARKWNCVVVLKGAATLIAAPDSLYVNSTGNSGMATGGTGDVLSGIILTLLGQNMTPVQAAAAGVFLHGLAADLLLEEFGERGITAGRLAENLHRAFRKIRDTSC